MSELKEKKQVLRDETVAYKCDFCDKVEHEYSTYKDTWYRFSRSHQGWGNDSCESYESFDVCSVRCFTAILKKELSELSAYARHDAEIADMPFAFAQSLAAALNKSEEQAA
ncbi:hypothetical protein AB0H71_29050 [Nocardia sp. NPDC050697]|uniref:hypothetical protein n=1 Tax=Nocardia sp. NPDC050697 TaxID=3155158 RepID=UPI003411ABD2